MPSNLPPGKSRTTEGNRFQVDLQGTPIPAAGPQYAQDRNHTIGSAQRGVRGNGRQRQEAIPRCHILKDPGKGPTNEDWVGRYHIWYHIQSRPRQAGMSQRATKTPTQRQLRTNQTLDGIPPGTLGGIYVFSGKVILRERPDRAGGKDGGRWPAGRGKTKNSMAEARRERRDVREVN